MKILHIYKTYFPETFGGCEKAIQSITEATQRHGCENHLLTITAESKFKQRKIKELTIDYYPSNLHIASCPLSFELFRYYKKAVRNVDIIHYHFPWPFSDLLQCFHKIDKPYLITYHSDIIRQKFLKLFYRPLMLRFLNHADVIVPTSQNLINSSLILKKFKNKCNFIPLCINPDDYEEKDESYCEFIQTHYGNDFILFIGVLRYYKGLHILLKAMKGFDIPLLIVGDGPEKKNLINLSKHLKLKNTIFLGSVTDRKKNTLLKLCRGVVLPSHLQSEAFGVTLLEGLLFGKPLISTRLGTGTSFVNQHLKTGLVVPPNDVNALKKALNTLVTDQILYEKWSHHAKLYFNKNFTPEQIGKQYMNLYKKLI